jgi:cytochrome P450
MMAEENIDGQLHYLQMVIRETFRLHPPVLLLYPMLCTKRSKIMGYDVLLGTIVFVNIWAINRDEGSWTDASEFIPERFGSEKVNYGGLDFRFFPGVAGQRMSPGMMFGVSNIQIALASLLYHFDWNLPNGGDPKELDMAEEYGITTHRRTQLLLNATRI